MLNRIDLFAEKLSKVPLSKYFADYTGGEDYDAACDYILHRFVRSYFLRLSLPNNERDALFASDHSLVLFITNIDWPNPQPTGLLEPTALKKADLCALHMYDWWPASQMYVKALLH